jgi:long-chain fatty acid transport protein
MGKFSLTVGALVASAGAASAGAVDRGMQSTAILFEKGNYVELTFGYLSPTVEGTESPLLGGQRSGNMYGNYETGSLSVKAKINDNLDAAFIIDRPYGAKTDYPTGTNYIAAGTTAGLSSTSYTALLKYRFASNISVLGGLRYQTLAADAFVPFLAPPGVPIPYKVVGERDEAWGYVLGVAWEKPEIAARVSLTYNSAIDYELPTTESSVFGTTTSTTETSTPQSLNLEFQSGIAPNTLLFGGIRWVEWSEFTISPPAYAALAGGTSLVFYNDDVVTYTLGLGYKFNENWSGAVTYAHDTAIGGYTLNLGPVDGYDSIALAATYTQGNVKVTGAIRYFALGDAVTQIGSFENNFEGNDAIGVGLRIGYTF